MEKRTFTFKRQEPAVLLDNNTECEARVKEAEFTMSAAGKQALK